MRPDSISSASMKKTEDGSAPVRAQETSIARELKCDVPCVTMLSVRESMKESSIASSSTCIRRTALGTSLSAFSFLASMIWCWYRAHWPRVQPPSMNGHF